MNERTACPKTAGRPSQPLPAMISPVPGRARPQAQWREQWELFENTPSVPWLLEEWIYPNRLEDFRDQEVLEAGCGAGHQMAVVRPYVRRLVGIDMSADTVARRRFAGDPGVEIRQGDILTYDTPERFDIVYCIGVLHHTDNPDLGFANLARLVKPGGRLIVWVYSWEGNALLRWVIEPLRKWVCRPMPRTMLWTLSCLATAACYPLIHGLYRLPISSLPYYEYFANARRLSFRRNAINVFDKLNAPQTTLISRERIESWFSPEVFESIHISSYVGVSWRGSGTKSAS